MSAFSEDLKRWMDPSNRPIDGSPSPIRLRARDVVALFWRYTGVWPTAIFRMAAWCHRRHVRGLPLFLQRVNTMLFGIEIASGLPVGPGLYIAHPVGTVIMASRVGANASFIHAVTLGMRDTYAFPTLGDGVMVGAGARVLGGIHLGDGCTVGANAVVLDDVPAGATAVGVPARILPPRAGSGTGNVIEAFPR